MHLELLRQAKAHHLAFARLIEEPLEQSHLWAEVGLEPDAEIMELATPAFVLGGFAIELYLKFLIHHEGGTIPHIHDLGELWTHLTERTRDALDEAGMYGPFDGLPAQRMSSAITPFVERFPRPFEAWRYSWEGSKSASMDQTALDDVLRALKRHCERIANS